MPRVVNLLRTFRHNNTSITESLKTFIPMFIANHSDDISDNILFTYENGADWTDKNAIGEIEYNEDGTITVDRGRKGYGTYSLVSKGDRKYIRVPSMKIKGHYIPYELVHSDWKNKKATYRPMPVFDEPKPVYNANSTAEKMMSMYYNDRKAKIQARLDAIRAEGANNGGSNLSATDTGNTQGVDEAIAQSDAAERQSAGASAAEAAMQRSTAEVQAQDRMGSSVEAIMAKINNSDDTPSVDPKALEEIVNAEAQFMETTMKNAPKIEGMTDAYISNLSDEQAKKAEAIAKESKEAYDKIDKCNIK